MPTTYYPRQSHWREDWLDVIRRCQRKPNTWAVVLPDRPLSRAKTISMKRTEPFVTPEGRLRAAIRNTRGVEGAKRADIQFMWQTKEDS